MEKLPNRLDPFDFPEKPTADTHTQAYSVRVGKVAYEVINCL